MQVLTNKSLLEDIRTNLADPPAEYSMIPFWFWNDKLDEETIETQLNEMLVKKIKAVCIHPMPDSFRKKDFIGGMPEEYLGERFMQCIKFTVEKAAQLGMKIWLYDEGGWPSGSAMGKVLEANSNFRRKVLKCNYRTRELQIIYDDHAPDLLNPDTVNCFLEITYEKYKHHVSQYFGTTITGIFTDEPNIKGHVGSWEIPWTDCLPEFFKELKGYDIEQYIQVLFKDPPDSLSKEQIKNIRYDFCDVVSLLFAESYFKKIHQWCIKNGLMLVGHLDREHSLCEHMSGGLNVPRLLQHFDVPGVDCIWRQIYPGKSHSDFPKFASSVAHTRNKKFILSESFGAYGLGLTFTQMKALVDHQYVRGVNLIVPHAFHYSCKGPRAFGVNSNLFLTDPRWSFFKDLALYSSRLSYLMSQGQSSAEIAVYYPIKSLWTSDRQTKDDKIIEASFDKLSHWLMTNQMEFDYVDDDVIHSSDCKIENGKMSIGQGNYKVLILSKNTFIQNQTLSVLEKFVKTGGLLIFIEPDDIEISGICSKNCKQLSGIIEKHSIQKDETEFIRGIGSGKTVFLDIVEQLDQYADMMPHNIKLLKKNSDIRVSRRILEDGTLYMLANESSRQHKILISFNAQGNCYLADTQTGDLTPYKPKFPQNYEIEFLPYDSKVFLFASSDNFNIAAGNQQTTEYSILAPNLWTRKVLRQFSFRNERLTGLPVEYELVEINNRFPWLEDFSNDFSGSIEYISSFELQAQPSGPVLLDLSNKSEDHMFRVWVNSHFAGNCIWAPFKLDITRLLNKGENNIRIVVSNSLANLMLSSPVITELKEKGWFNIYHKKILRLFKK